MKGWTDEECDALWGKFQGSGTYWRHALIRAAVEEVRAEHHADCTKGALLLAVEARREEREAIRQIINAEASAHPGCCHHLRDAILARGKEPSVTDRPVSLAERIAACCPCSQGAYLCGFPDINYPKRHGICQCSSAYARREANEKCRWPGHALEADAKALEASHRNIHAQYDNLKAAAAEESRRVEALEAVLREAPEMLTKLAEERGHHRSGTVRLFNQWLAKRAAALADERQKGRSDG